MKHTISTSTLTVCRCLFVVLFVRVESNITFLVCCVVFDVFPLVFSFEFLLQRFDGVELDELDGETYWLKSSKLDLKKSHAFGTTTRIGGVLKRCGAPLRVFFMRSMPTESKSGRSVVFSAISAVFLAVRARCLHNELAIFTMI